VGTVNPTNEQPTMKTNQATMGLRWAARLNNIDVLSPSYRSWTLSRGECLLPQCRRQLTPHRSTTCTHSYSRDAVLDVIKNARASKRPAKCPVAGCSAILQESALKVSFTVVPVDIAHAV
jgi:hypothetical protein